MKHPGVCLLLSTVLGSAMLVGAPDEELLGKSKGYPIGVPTTWFYDEAVRVGSFSHLDEIFKHHVLARSPSPLPLEAAPAPSFTYRFENQECSIEDYLRRQ